MLIADKGGVIQEAAADKLSQSTQKDERVKGIVKKLN
jgi:hypothetical protein